jgi:hypothetical protein
MSVQPSPSTGVGSPSARAQTAAAVPAAWLAVAVGAALLVTLLVAVAPRSASAQDQWQPEPCPAMTDSIRRMYLVVHGREPETAELTQTVERYWTGEAGLELLTTERLASPEYLDWYGELDNDAFIVETHRTALGTAPSADDRAQWLALLDGGLSRARLVLLLAESEPVVRATGTAEPLAGYLQWYPAGTHWYCGSGIANELPIRPLAGPTLYADLLFTNGGEAQDVIALRTTIEGQPHIVLQRGSLPPGFTSYEWGGAFDGDGNYGTHLDIRAGDDTSWIVVFYPEQIPDRRAGWQLP